MPIKYIVKTGDTLSKIAKDNNISVKDLQKWNNITDPNVILEGQELIISEPVSLKEMALRQAFMESNFNPNASNSLGATGLYQIRSAAMNDFNKATGRALTLDSLLVPEKNVDVYNWYMDNLMNASWNQHEQDDKVKQAKALAAYNWGRGNLYKYLERVKLNGGDIYNSLDWVEGLPKETRNYINFILNGDSVNIYKNKATYEAAKLLHPNIVEMIKKRKTGGPLNYCNFIK